MFPAVVVIPSDCFDSAHCTTLPDMELDVVLPRCTLFSKTEDVLTELLFIYFEDFVDLLNRSSNRGKYIDWLNHSSWERKRVWRCWSGWLVFECPPGALPLQLSLHFPRAYLGALYPDCGLFSSTQLTPQLDGAATITPSRKKLDGLAGCATYLRNGSIFDQAITGILSISDNKHHLVR